jgi:cell division protein FtsL
LPSELRKIKTNTKIAKITMENNSKEHVIKKRSSNFLTKVLLTVLCVIVIVLLALIAKAFASLKAINNRLDALEEEKTLGFKSLRSEEHERGKRRSKRGTETAIKALIKLEKFEGR